MNIPKENKEGFLKTELESTALLGVLFDYVSEISRERQIDKILMLMADLGKELAGADRCSLWLMSHNSDELWTKVAHGISRTRIPSSQGIVGLTFRERKPIIINDAYSDSRFNPEVDKKTGYRTRNIIALPIFGSDGEIMGVFQAINKITSDNGFSQTDLQRLTLAATYSGTALESAQMRQEIEDTQKDVIFMMGEAGEMRSKETGNHVRRVSEYSFVIAEGYGLPTQECELLRTCSPMHDIGKVVIPDVILMKPGKLTEEEFEIMKTHAEVGYHILRNSQRKILKSAAIVAHQHHEKWNGKGYPRGVAGEEIHLFGRITAIADVFDALGSDRVYKKAWELDRILALFKEERGQHFDPKLVDVFMDRLDALLQIHDRFKDK
ncbi:MAG: HD domain-containing protein [Helicobacteraceae bacterium]|nr:HD domain-containing protein [Helicobacteraceae bacterium]